MSVAPSSNGLDNSVRPSPREQLRPNNLEMNRMHLPLSQGITPADSSPNKPSPQIYRQSTLTGASYSNENDASRENLH